MAQEFVNRVVLSTGKTVLLREFRIKHQELAFKAVGKRGEGNPNLQGMYVQNELLKIMIVQVDGKDLPKAEMEDLDKLLTPKEYRQLLKVLEQLTGADDDGGDASPKIEVVSYGSK